MNLKKDEAPPVVFTPRVVKERVRLNGGWVISINIPDSANDALDKKVPSVHEESFTDSSGTLIRYAKFSQTVKGGVGKNGKHKSGRVFFHLHHEQPMQFVGKTIVCIADVFRKVMDDGEVSVYVDLRLVPEETNPTTHRLATIPHKAAEIERGEGFLLFETPEPLIGTIVVAPVNSPIVLKSETAKKATVPHSSRYETSCVKTAFTRMANPVKALTPVKFEVECGQPAPIPEVDPKILKLASKLGAKVTYRPSKVANKSS